MSNVVQKANARSKGSPKPQRKAEESPAKKSAPAKKGSKEARGLTRSIFTWLAKNEGFTPSDDTTAERLALHIDRQIERLRAPVNA